MSKEQKKPAERAPSGQTCKNLSKKINKVIFEYNLEYKINIYDSSELAKTK